MITQLARLRRKHLYKNHQNSEKAQRRVLRKVVNGLNGTAYQNIYGSSFENLPITTYEDIFPYIDSMLKGEKNILVKGRVRLFAKSSGTTNAKSKYIPTPKSYLRGNHYRAGKDMLTLYVASSGKIKFLAGKTLAITGSLSSSPYSKDILCGDVSALLAKELPWWWATRRALDLSIALLPSWEEKMNAIVSRAKSSDVRAIAGTPTWVSLILEKIISVEKVKYIEEVWPNLQVFFHGAVSFVPYRQMFQNLSRRLNYFEVYNASEGYFAVQDRLENGGELLLLINHEVFYEFIPLSSLGTKDQKILKLWEVKTGEQYALVISTTSGLYRYIIGDTIRFSSLRPYRISITGRTKHFVNAFGEEVIVENTNTAIARASEISSAAVSHYTLGPSYMSEGNPGTHEWYIEFSTQPEDQNLFNETLDKTLRELNSDYDAKRTGDKIMSFPIINIVPKGTFYKFMESRGKLGGQHKVPPLSNTREYLEEIKKLLV